MHCRNIVLPFLIRAMCVIIRCARQSDCVSTRSQRRKLRCVTILWTNIITNTHTKKAALGDCLLFSDISSLA